MAIILGMVVRPQSLYPPEFFDDRVLCSTIFSMSARAPLPSWFHLGCKHLFRVRSQHDRLLSRGYWHAGHASSVWTRDRGCRHRSCVMLSCWSHETHVRTINVRRKEQYLFCRSAIAETWQFSWRTHATCRPKLPSCPFCRC